ncbi:hypothetical protein PMIN04_002843 [Paraphaeosphaeria minitans]
MRTTAVIALLTSAAMAAPEHTFTGRPIVEDPAYDGIVYAPPVTVTVTQTETTTQYDTIASYETTATSWKLAPPVTVTVTERVGELYDQSYDDYELGDLIVAPTVVTETKTFTLAGHGLGHGERKPSTTELVKKWHIAQATPYATTVTEFTSTTWVNEHITSTIWVDAAEPTEEPSKDSAEDSDEESDEWTSDESDEWSSEESSEESAEESAEESDEEHPAEPTKTNKLEDSSSDPEEPEPTDSKTYVVDLPDGEEPNTEELEELLAEIWKEEQAAAEKAAQEAAKKVFESAAEGDEPHSTASSSSSQAQAHKPSRPHGPTPTLAPTPFHSSTPYSSPKSSTFATETSPQTAPTPQPSVSASKWKGTLFNTPDGTCGPKGGQIAYTCKDNSQGSCCSSYGHCGSEDAHCGVGCMSAFGTCSPSASSDKTQPQPQLQHGVVKKSETPDQVHSERVQKMVDTILADLASRNKTSPHPHGDVTQIPDTFFDRIFPTPDASHKAISEEIRAYFESIRRASHGAVKPSPTRRAEPPSSNQDLLNMIIAGISSVAEMPSHTPSSSAALTSQPHASAAKIKQDFIEFMSWVAVSQRAQELKKAETKNGTGEGEHRKIGEKVGWTNVDLLNATAVSNATAAAANETAVVSGSVVRGTPLADLKVGFPARTGDAVKPKTSLDAWSHDDDDEENSSDGTSEGSSEDSPEDSSDGTSDDSSDDE